MMKKNYEKKVFITHIKLCYGNKDNWEWGTKIKVILFLKTQCTHNEGEMSLYEFYYCCTQWHIKILYDDDLKSDLIIHLCI